MPGFPTGDLRWRSIERAGLDREPEFWRAIHSAHGDVVHFTGPHACTGVASVEAVDAIMRRDGEELSRGFLLNTLGKIMLGRRALVSLEGQAHRDVRERWAPTFAAGVVRTDHAPLIARDVTAFADRLDTSRPIDVLEAMSLVTMRTAARILLGDDTEKQADEFSQSVYLMLDTEMEATRHPLGIVPALILRSGTFLAARQRLRRTVAAAVDALRASQETSSFLGRLAAYRDPRTGRALARSEIVDAGVQSMAAATHTTAILLTWSFHLLSTRPQLQEDAHAEVIAACGPGGISPSSIDRLRHLVHCRRILMEAMRLFPPLWIVHRTPARDYEAAGYRFAGRRLISIPIYVLHRDARYYEQPDEFRPDRWAGRPPRGAFLPFGTGGRGCMGENLAMTQALIVLSLMLARFRLRPTMADVRPVACGYLLKPTPAVRLEFDRR